jgi:hypothetical protein
MKNRSFKIWGILWWLVAQMLQWNLLLYCLFSLIWRLALKVTDRWCLWLTQW